jgi:phosphoribosylformimino-5-aminoimidazole carboxamide ribotide isomerase
MEHLQSILHALDNDKTKLVIDLSCRRKDDKWFVATNKWQTITEFELNQGTYSSPYHFQPSRILQHHLIHPL